MKLNLTLTEIEVIKSLLIFLDACGEDEIASLIGDNSASLASLTRKIFKTTMPPQDIGEK